MPLAHKKKKSVADISVTDQMTSLVHCVEKIKISQLSKVEVQYRPSLIIASKY